MLAQSCAARAATLFHLVTKTMLHRVHRGPILLLGKFNVLSRIQTHRSSTYIEAGLAIANHRRLVAGMRGFGCEIPCSNDEALVASL